MQEGMSKSSPLCAGGDLSEDHCQAIAALNFPGTFTGKVNNGANIGKTTEEIVDMWNEVHAEDMIILESQPDSPSLNRTDRPRRGRAVLLIGHEALRSATVCDRAGLWTAGLKIWIRETYRPSSDFGGVLR